MLDPAREPEALRGLWSSFLLLKRDGTLQCYYDDEDTPHRTGFFRHQWVTMKTWDTNARQWVNPVTVSRAHNRPRLSRDGMASVVELPSGRLLCVFESVQTSPPHANCIRLVTSDNGGRTWSWQDEERRIVFQSRKPNHLSVSPWITRPLGGQLLFVFATDEDQPSPSPSGIHPWYLDRREVREQPRWWSHLVVCGVDCVCRNPSLLRTRRPAVARHRPVPPRGDSPRGGATSVPAPHRRGGARQFRCGVMKRSCSR